jgi:hypothetical protein
LAALAVALTGTSHAAILFTANLTNAQEVPPATVSGRAESYGTASFELNDAQTALSFSAEIYNIDFTGTQTPDTGDNLVSAHIHRAPAGVTGPVVWGFFGAPFNDTDPTNVVFTAFASGVGGTLTGAWDANEGNATTLAAELPSLLAGNTYINFHTVDFPGGEIRGQLTRVAEPATLALLGLGFVGLATVRRRPRR